MSVVEERKPQTSTVTPRSSGYYSPSEIQQWQSVHGPSSFPPGYRIPNTSNPPSPPPPTKSTSTTKEQTSESNVPGYVSGQTSVKVPTKPTVTVSEPKTISVSESVLAQSDVLRKKEGEPPLEKTIPLTVVSYQTTKGVESKQTEYVQPSPVKKAVGAFLSGGAYIGLSLVAGAAKLTGQTILGIKPTVTEEDINTRIAKTFGSEATNPLGTLTSKETAVEKASTIAGAAAFFGLGLITGGKEAKPTGLKPSVIKNIISGVKQSEEFTPISSTTKTGTVTKFEQVGIPTGSEERVSPEIKQAVGPKGEPVPTPKSAKPETITGIGSKGEPVKTTTEPKATLTQKEAFGEPKIPVTLISKTATGFIRSPTASLEPTKVIAFEITPKQASELGLEKAEGLIRAYKGSLTEETIAKLSTMQKEGELADVGLLLKEPTIDVSKASGLYASAVSEPKMFESFPEMVRPEVTKLVVGGGRYELKEIPSKFTSPSEKDFRSLTGGEFGIGETKPTVGAGSSGKAASLEMTPQEAGERLTKLFEERPTTEPKNLQGLGLTTKGSLISEEVQILKTPPEERSILGTKGLTSKQSQSTDLITKQVTQQVTTNETTPSPNTTKLTGDGETGGFQITDEKKYQKILKAKKKKRQEFIGNVPLESIVGVRKREETTYGEQARKIVAKEFREGSKSKTSFETSKESVPFLKPGKNTFEKEFRKKESTEFKREKQRKFKL